MIGTFGFTRKKTLPTRHVDDKPDLNNLKLRFAVFSDLHFGLDDDRIASSENDGKYQNRATLLVDSLKNEKNGYGLDFFIGNGDVVHSTSSDFSTSLEMLEDVTRNYLDDVSIPYYLTPGNHDRVSNSDWNNLLGYNRSNSFEFDDFGFILLDSSDVNGARQVCLDKTYLDSKINEYEERKGVFFISHVPRFKGYFHNSESKDSPQCNDIMNSINNADNIVAMLSGHFHYEDDRVTTQEKPLFFDGHVDSYGVPYYAYRIFEVYDNYFVTKQMNMFTDKIENIYLVDF